MTNAVETTAAVAAPQFRTARPDSTRGKLIAVMIANAGKTMEETMEVMMKELGIERGNARGAYKWLVENNYAPGVVTEAKRGRKPSAEPKQPKEKKVKEPKVTVSSAPAEEAPKKTAEELKAIREANRETLKNAVKAKAQKVKKTKTVTVEEETEVLPTDMDAPATISQEDLNFVTA